jgi:phage terminase large subunit-like protein
MALVHGEELAGREAILTAPALTLPAAPDGEWDAWLIEGDRGSGKSTCGVRWLLDRALAGPEGSVWAVCAPTRMRARDSLERLIASAAPGDVTKSSPQRLEVIIRDRTLICGFSSESPDSIRGYRLSGAFFDDADGMRYYSFWDKGLRLALRGGSRLAVAAAKDARWGLPAELRQEASDAGRVRLTVL